LKSSLSRCQFTCSRGVWVAIFTALQKYHQKSRCCKKKKELILLMAVQLHLISIISWFQLFQRW